MTDLLLPRLKQDTTVAKGKVGVWEMYQDSAFRDLADSLDYQAPGQQQISNVSSVPTIWARPLTVEMALFDRQHPLHGTMVGQWRGMLAAIALAEVEGFDLKVQFLDLSQNRSHPFAQALYQLLPQPANVLYTRGDRNPWEEIYIWLWRGNPVGITSPSTLVCPSEKGLWTGLRWFKNGILVNPSPFLNKELKEILWRWLENLQNRLLEYDGTTKARECIIGLLEDFRNDLAVANGNSLPALELSDNHAFFGEIINRGALALLNRPVRIPPKPSNVRVIPSTIKSPSKPLLIIDESLADYWGVPKHAIWVHRDRTLASLNLQELKSGTIKWDDVLWLTPDELFLPELTFLDLDNALPGALMPKTTFPPTFRDEKITPLLPLNPILLDYFTPEDLANSVELEPFVSVEGEGIRVTLSLPLSGMESSPSIRRYQREYILREENAIRYLPVLTVWPNLKAGHWKQYYVFYYDGDYGEQTFRIFCPKHEQLREFQDIEGTGWYQIYSLETFPGYLVCKNSYHQDIGLILLPTPPSFSPRGIWRVGLDFGTSFTNVYVKGENSPETPLDINKEKLQLNITDSSLSIRIPALIENFIPETFLPADQPLPLYTVLTHKNGNEEGELQPILDGRIYIPDPTAFNPSKRWIRTDLKWSNLRFAKAFLRHLILHISAIATAEKINEIHWCISYPTAFSKTDKMTFHRSWLEICDHLAPKTGLKYLVPQIDDERRFCTESVALAQYFNDKEKHPLVRTTCIDIGGGTSDISIWENRSIIYQCSLSVAGKNIFSEILAHNHPYARQLMEEFIPGGWQDGTDLSIMAKIDVALRHGGEKWLREKRIYKNNDPYFQHLMTITAIGIAGIYYYIGLCLRVLHEQGKYSTPQITPVYVGGNGSRFFHWLSPTGIYDKNAELNQLLSYILSKASGFPDTQEKTQLSSRPKDEIAAGLVVAQTELKGITEYTDFDVIAGEDFYLEYHDDQQEYKRQETWQSRLHLEGTITKMDIPNLTNLKNFLYEFHEGLRSLRIESIQPLPKNDYKHQREEEANSQLWREVYRHLEDKLLDVRGDAKDIREATPFIMGLKSLLHVLGNRWADAWKG